MMAPAHMSAGLLAGYGVSVLAGLPLVSAETGVLVVVGAISALVPDIDHPNSTIRKRTGLLGFLAGGWFGHRGFTHTLVALALVSLASGLLLPGVLAAAIAGGYASHLLLDALTRSGIPALWPVTRRPVKLLPRPLQVRTGSWREAVFLVAMWAALAGVMLARRGQF